MNLKVSIDKQQNLKRRLHSRQAPKHLRILQRMSTNVFADKYQLKTVFSNYLNFHITRLMRHSHREPKE